MEKMTLGIDVACRAAHQASLADDKGTFVWSARRFHTTSDDLEALWSSLPDGIELTVVMEPTRNAWVPLTAWFRRRGAKVIVIPSEQSADLRDYYSKHTKSDRLDSRILARVPLLHPEGLRASEGLGPAESIRRATKLRSSLVKRRSAIVARLDSYLELLSPAWHACFKADLVQNTPLQLLAAGYADPHALRRLGKARLAKLIWRYSHRKHGEDRAVPLLEAAAETLRLWDGDEIDFGELADDIAVEARLALQLTREIEELERRIAVLLHELDPSGIMVSVPGVALVNGAQILARLGDPNRFRSLAGARSFSGLVPSLNSSGVNARHGGPTKSGDAHLRESLFMAANWARRIDPTLARRYHRLMVHEGKHHNSALCHISTALLNRIIACWRAGEPYVIRDVDGSVLTREEGRRICQSRYHVSADIRAERRAGGKQVGTSRRSKESPSAPSTGSSPNEATPISA
jgi:transposase